jgi:putative ABC transport system substrate-binding protein
LDISCPVAGGHISCPIDRIARGTKPANLPIETPTRFTLSVNLEAAQMLGVKFSPAFLVRVDRTIN